MLILLTLKGYEQTLTPVLYPLYIQGHGTSVQGDERKIPYVCRMTVSGLQPNATYFYFNRWAVNPSSPVQQGGIIFVEQSGSFRRTTSPDLGLAANRGLFVTDATGSYTGWFASESGIATDFQAGNQLYFRLVLNDGNGGITPVTVVTAAEPVSVLAWNDYSLPYDPGTSVGSGVRSANANSVWVPKNFIMLFNNVTSNGRPISGTFIESDGTANTTANGYVPFYGSATTGINGFNNRWGTIIPDNLPNGIQRVDQYSLANGALVNSCVDADGDWGGTNGNTVNPTVGMTNPLILDCVPGGGCNIALSTSQTNVTCFAQNTGSVSLTVAGAAQPAVFSWSNGSTTKDITGLAAGSYTVTVTDANSCTATKTVIITQPASALSVDAIATNATCGNSNGSVNLIVGGGTFPYTYNWNNGATSEDINGLAAGAYTVTITDANGCTKTAGATVNNMGGPTVTVFGTTNVLCFGGATGSINIDVSGGTTPYVYNWSNGATSQDVNGLIAGNFSVTVTDASGCAASTTAVIAQPASAITATTTVTDAACGVANGSINVTVNGGTAPYSFAWSNGANTKDLDGLAAGNYSVTITDVNGCISIKNASVSNVGGPAIAIANTTNVVCFGQSNGSINITVTGGVAPYTYLWSNGATTKDISNLLAGTYSVVVTDMNGCAASLNTTITQPKSLSINKTFSHVSCFGTSTGSINITVTGGSAPYAYLWNNGATTEDLNHLSAGNYSVMVTDARGCTASEAVIISQPSQLIVSENHRINSCSDDNTSINVSATGGTAPYIGTGTFSRGAGEWTFTVTDGNSCTVSTTVTIATISPLTASAISNGISCHGGTATVTVTAIGGNTPYSGTGAFSRSAGTWNFSVTDASGCSATATTTIAQPDSLIASSTHGIITCKGGGTAMVMVAAVGGKPPYAGTGSFSHGPGSYSYTVTDDNGCTSVTTGNIPEPAASLVALAVAEPITTCGGQARVTVTATGGSTPYSYPGAGIYYRDAGTWSFTVTDANGCTAQTAVTIPHPECVTVYPNPVSNNIIVDHTQAEEGAAIKIFSVSGSLLSHETVGAGTTRTTIDIKKFAAGIYVLVYYNDGKAQAVRFRKIQ